MSASRLALTLAVLSLAAACGRKDEAAKPAAPPTVAAPAPAVPTPAAAPVEGFTHEAAVDYQGYYIPVEGTAPKVGPLQLQNLTLGAPSDFTQWEANKRMATYGPVLVEFADLNSPMVKNEMGGENHRTVRVLPDAYRFDAKGVSFRGHAEGLGEVTFEGTFDTAALQASRDVGYGDGVVLRGTLSVGGTAFRNMAFTYFGGD